VRSLAQEGTFRCRCTGLPENWTQSVAAGARPGNTIGGVRGLVLVCGLAVAALASGCGGDHGLPTSCRDGSSAVARALRAAPGRVELAQGVPLSRCVKRAVEPDDVVFVGGTLVSVAVALAERARADPESPSALQLGYLLGAAHRGGATTLVSSELLRRLDQEAAGIASHSRAYARGLQAGRAAG
jgi:hypothetical protein